MASTSCMQLGSTPVRQLVARPFVASISAPRQTRCNRLQQQQMTGFATPSLSVSTRRPVQTAAAMEIFQLADEGAFIGGTAAAMFAMVLIGLAFGFVLLRVEALVEEGKI